MSVNIATDILPVLWPWLHAVNESDAVWWTQAELVRWIRHFAIAYTERYGVNILVATQPIAAGQATYDAPTDHLSTLHVSLNGTALIPVSTYELEALSDSFSTATGTPIYWYSDKGVPVNVIGLYPTPTIADAGGTLEFVYHHYPCRISEDLTQPVIQAPAIIADYLHLKTLGRAYSEESDARSADIATAADGMAMLHEAMLAKWWGSAQ